MGINESITDIKSSSVVVDDDDGVSVDLPAAFNAHPAMELICLDIPKESLDPKAYSVCCVVRHRFSEPTQML